MKKITTSFVLDAKEDADLLRWLNTLPKSGRSAAIRATLRAGLGRGGASLGDVYRMLSEINAKLDRGVLVAATGAVPAGDWPAEPPEAAAALDALAKL